jgi:glycosyltransferase involved in cell wall biosynthesis
MLSLSDLFVLPSYSEGLPVSVLEAMATGLPVISTDVGGLREILRDGENAFLVPPAKPEQLAEKIGICMQDRPLAIRLATRARQDVINEFDILPMLDTYRRIYRSLVPQ